MSTPAQIAANQANAQKSTGPKTEQGKAHSCMNRLTHGFASAQSIIPGENLEDFMALLQELLLEHQPKTPTEEILVEKMAQTQWLTQRALNLQGEAFLTLAIAGKPGIPENLGLLIRYYTTAQNAFHKAHNDLVKTQKERKKSEFGFVPQKAAAQPAQPPAPPSETLEMEPVTAPTVTDVLDFLKKTA
jgi:hypothetical protein